MDAYELPEEFAHLQAQDMSKIGFINDLVRGIKKVIPTNAPAVETQAFGMPDSNSSTAPLLQRVFMFLEDGNWTSADEYCEKVLDLEPTNARAYLGKLMASLRVKTQTQLASSNDPLETNGNFQKALRFADPQFKSELEAISNAVRERISREALEAQHRQTYNTALALAKENTESSLRKAAELLRGIEGWMDSVKLIVHYEAKISQIAAFNESSYTNAMLSLENGKRFEAGNRYGDALEAYRTAQNHLNAIENFKDSKIHADWCARKLQELNAIANPILTIQIPDSKNPLALADGSHYVFDFINRTANTREHIVVDLVKGTTKHEMRLAPGEYSIELNVYGWNTAPGSEAPVHKASCSAHLSLFEKWYLTSNRPGLFSKLQLTAERNG
jgi:hypothetical protein